MKVVDKVMMLIIAIACLGIIKSSSAQEKVACDSIYGVIVDADNSPVEFVEVYHFNKEGTEISNTLSRENGGFAILVDQVGDSIVLRHIACDQISINLLGRECNLDTIKIDCSGIDLAEVLVKASASRSDVNRDSYAITGQMRKVSAKAEDLLERVEGITINKYTKAISVDNSTSVLILVNGVRKNQDYIRSISPDLIRSIDVIRNVSGRYSTQYDAIIDIKLKTDIKGYDVSVADESFTNMKPRSGESAFVFNHLNMNGYYTNGNTTLYGSLYNSYNDFSSIQIESNNSVGDRSISMKSNPESSLYKEKSNSFTLGTDIVISKGHQISAEINYNSTPEGNGQFFSYSNDYDNGITVVNTTEEFGSESTDRSVNGTLFYNGELSERLILNADLTYYNYSADNSDSYSSIIDNEMTSRVQRSENSKRYSDVNAEATYKISEEWELEGGINRIDKREESAYGVDEVGGSGDESSVTGHETITTDRTKYSLYLSVAPTDKSSLKFGGMVEKYNSESDSGLDKKSSETGLLPYLSFNYGLSDMQSIRLTYKTYSYYPSLSQLVPLRSQNDMLSYTTGNPNLVSSWKHNMSARFTLLGPQLRVKPFYTVHNRPVSKVGEVVDGILEYSYKNIGKIEEYGVNISSQISISKKISMDNSLTLSKEKFKYENSDQQDIYGGDREENNWVMKSQLIYMENQRNMLFGLEYRKDLPKKVVAQGHNKNNNSYIGLFANKRFLDNRLSLTGFYMLPIDGLGMKYMQGGATSGNGFNSEEIVDISLLKNSLVLSINFRFGKNSEKVKRSNKSKEYESEGKGGGLF